MVRLKNRQWAITDGELKTVKPAPEYVIPAKRLVETKDGENAVYVWPIEIAEKPWADIDEFTQAYMKALQLLRGKYQGEVDHERLEASLDLGFELAEKRNTYAANIR